MCAHPPPLFDATRQHFGHHARSAPHPRSLRTNMADAEIKALIETMHSEQFAAATSKDEMQIDTFFDKFYATDMVFIRPSGNPMDVRSAKGMWLGDDVKTEAQTLKSIDTVKVLGCGMAAIATYTSHEKFSYKGSPVRTPVAPTAHPLALIHVPVAPTLTSDAWTRCLWTAERRRRQVLDDL